MPRRRGGFRGGLSEAAYAASDMFGSLLKNRFSQQDRDREQARQAPGDLTDFITRLVPSIAQGNLSPDSANTLYERVAHALGMTGPQQFDFQQFVQQPDLIGNVLREGSKAEYRERVPTDAELDYAGQQQGAFSFPLRRTEADTMQDVTTQEGPDLSPIRNVLNAQRQALPPLREPSKGGRRTVTTVNAKGQKVEQLIDDQGNVVKEFLAPPDKPEKPAPDPNAPKPFRDDPELPQGVVRYIGSLPGKHKDAASAQQEVANQMPRLLAAHPNLNPIKVKQAIDAMFRQPGQSIVIPPGLMNQMFSGGGEPQ